MYSIVVPRDRRSQRSMEFQRACHFALLLIVCSGRGWLTSTTKDFLAILLHCFLYVFPWLEYTFCLCVYVPVLDKSLNLILGLSCYLRPPQFLLPSRSARSLQELSFHIPFGPPQVHINTYAHTHTHTYAHTHISSHTHTLIQTQSEGTTDRTAHAI